MPGATVRGTATALVACAIVLCFAVPVYAQSEALHVTPPGITDTDVCAMCHRAHTSAAKVTARSYFDPELEFDALIVGTDSPIEEAGLCLSCHGLSGAGATTEVETAFSAEATHALAPADSPFGPSPKNCSSCHDSHGSAQAPGGGPFPALLRVFDIETDEQSHAGEEYCEACHKADAGSRWNGLDVFDQTAHSIEMTVPASGTGIRCSNCHEPHGSDLRPLIVPELVPPAAATTVPVPANDRRFCFVCHLTAEDTFVGRATYETGGHGLASDVVTISAAWPSAETTRLVGECQTCHDPMGRDDGDGNAIPKMTVLEGKTLCYRCHAESGPSLRDLESIEPTLGPAGAVDLLASVVPSAATDYHARLAAYRKDPAAPGVTLTGPREFGLSDPGSDVAIGDIDGDGANEVVSSDGAASSLAVYGVDSLSGISLAAGKGSLAIAAPADFVCVADVVSDASGRPEIAVVDASAGQLRLYRYAGTSLSLVSGPHAVGNGATSLASGDTTGTLWADLVVTAGDDDTFRVFTESAGSLASSGPFSTRSGPRGASVGDAWLGGTKQEIVIVNAGETTGTVSVYRATGTALGHVDDAGPSGTAPWDSVVADVLPGTTPTSTSGAEVTVVFRSESATSGVNVFAQLSSGGLATPLAYDTGKYYVSSGVEAADVDGDGRPDVLVGNAGRWTRDATREAASIQVLRADASGTVLATAETLWLGGVETAGSTPQIALGDLGIVTPTRHPVGAIPDTHVSTEVATLVRHVECPDCHNSHEATATPAAAPDAPGALRGAWGVEVTNESVSTITYLEKRGVDYEYEVCLKCHSGWSELGETRNIAFEVNPLNPSEHAIEATVTGLGATSGSYVSGWGNDSVLYCIDCHTNSDALAADGPHVSKHAPVLERPYLGVHPSSSSLLCYKCHLYTVYGTGQFDGLAASQSLFYDSSITGREKLHWFHVSDRGFGCVTCHESHGSQDENHLIRSDVGYSHAASGGSCANDCHIGGSTNSYSRP